MRAKTGTRTSPKCTDWSASLQMGVFAHHQLSIHLLSMSTKCALAVTNAYVQDVQNRVSCIAPSS
jgi:hypothetical protein